MCVHENIKRMMRDTKMGENQKKAGRKRYSHRGNVYATRCIPKQERHRHNNSICHNAWRWQGYSKAGRTNDTEWLPSD